MYGRPTITSADLWESFLAAAASMFDDDVVAVVPEACETTGTRIKTE